MIEAVNSSIASTQVLRSNVEHVAAVPVISAKPVSTEDAPQTPKAPYISPYIAIDTTSNKAVIQIRNRDTGDVKDQYPSESRLAQLSQQQARQVNTTKIKEHPEASAPTTSAPSLQTADIITVQDVTSSAPSNISLPSPQVAAAALSAAAQSASPVISAGVSVSA